VGNFSLRPKIALDLLLSKTDSSSTNRSTISWTLRLRERESQPSYDFDKDSTASLTFTLPSGTTLVSGNLNPGIPDYEYDFRSSGLTTQTLGTGSFVVQHNSAGVGNTVSGSASSNSPGLGTASDSASITLTDYVRLPSTPSTAPSIARPVDGLPTKITITSGISTFFGSSPDYRLQVSTNNVNWTSVTGLANAETSMGSGRIYTWTSAVATTSYWFRTRAVDSEGGSSFSASSVVAGAPGTPTGLTVSKNASFPKRRDLSWTAPSNNGATITSYTIQARYSSDGGTTWDNAYTTLGTNKDPNFVTSDLEIAKTYQFRVAATNSSGTGAYVATVSPFTFISAYGYIFQLAGANLVPVAIQNLKIYVGVGGPGADANGWRVAQNVKKYTASGWIDLQT
jgi:hypothetical protein